jgi:hypothetical protein
MKPEFLLHAVMVVLLAVWAGAGVLAVIVTVSQ